LTYRMLQGIDGINGQALAGDIVAENTAQQSFGAGSKNLRDS